MFFQPGDRGLKSRRLFGEPPLASLNRLRKNSLRAQNRATGAKARADAEPLYAALKRRSSTAPLFHSAALPQRWSSTAPLFHVATHFPEFFSNL
jgi:hypothetical protein